jgi:hypothetical protein
LIAQPESLYQPILEQRSLRLMEVLSEKKLRGVYKVAELSGGPPLILKVNKLFPGKLRREADLLQLAEAHELKHLKLPRIVDRSDHWMLMDCVQLEHYTRDTILLKAWTTAEAEKWIAALQEFQQIPQSSRGFSKKEKLKGAFYPLIRLIELRKAVNKRLSLWRRVQLGWMALRYLAYRPLLRQVTVHYDLNTFNFTNEQGSEKMLMIDFEAGAYRGDSLYDILYYLTIPTVRLEDWVFQRTLLGTWFRASEGKERFLSQRLRFQLVVLCLQRIQRFIDDPEKAQVYVDNLDLLFNGSRYRNWRIGLQQA